MAAKHSLFVVGLLYKCTKATVYIKRRNANKCTDFRVCPPGPFLIVSLLCFFENYDWAERKGSEETSKQNAMGKNSISLD